MGVQHGQLELGDLAQPMTMAADTAKESQVIRGSFSS